MEGAVPVVEVEVDGDVPTVEGAVSVVEVEVDGDVPTVEGAVPGCRGRG